MPYSFVYDLLHRYRNVFYKHLKPYYCLTGILDEKELDIIGRTVKCRKSVFIAEQKNVHHYFSHAKSYLSSYEKLPETQMEAFVGRVIKIAKVDKEDAKPFLNEYFLFVLILRVTSYFCRLKCKCNVLHWYCLHLNMRD